MSSEANPPNVGTIDVGSSSATYHPWLPLRPRAARPEGVKPDIAVVPVGTAYIGVAVHSNPQLPPQGEPDVLRGAWLPVRIESKEHKTYKPRQATLLVPYRTVYGGKRPQTYKQLLLVRGVKGAIIAPPASECVEVIRSNDEVLLLVNSHCEFTVTSLDGHSITLSVGDELKWEALTVQPVMVEAANSCAKRDAPQDDADETAAIFALWHRLSFAGLEHLFDNASHDSDWLHLLCTTLKAVYPRWSKRIAHIYPEPPHGSVCIPLNAATAGSPYFGSQWAIDSQYFSGFYDACGFNTHVAAGAMPASRLLMRCLYEMVWLSRAPNAEHPAEGSVLLTIPSLFD